jgi:hypothetical protein
MYDNYMGENTLQSLNDFVRDWCMNCFHSQVFSIPRHTITRKCKNLPNLQVQSIDSGTQYRNLPRRTPTFLRNIIKDIASLHCSLG